MRYKLNIVFSRTLREKLSWTTIKCEILKFTSQRKNCCWRMIVRCHLQSRNASFQRTLPINLVAVCVTNGPLALATSCRQGRACNSRSCSTLSPCSRLVHLCRCRCHHYKPFQWLHRMICLSSQGCKRNDIECSSLCCKYFQALSIFHKCRWSCNCFDICLERSEAEYKKRNKI